MLTEEIVDNREEGNAEEVDDLFSYLRESANIFLIDEVLGSSLDILANPKTYQILFLSGVVFGYLLLVTIGGGFYQLEILGIGNIMCLVGTICTLSLLSHKVRGAFFEYLKGLYREVIGK